MKLKSKHLVEILKNISDYHYGKPMLYRMLSESLDNDNIINTSHEEDILINNILNEYPSLKEYLQKEGVFNKFYVGKLGKRQTTINKQIDSFIQKI